MSIRCRRRGREGCLKGVGEGGKVVYKVKEEREGRLSIRSRRRREGSLKGVGEGVKIVYKE